MENIPEKSILVTMDVRSLFKDIPNKEGIETVETAMKRKKYRSKNYDWLFLSCHVSVI